MSDLGTRAGGDGGAAPVATEPPVITEKPTTLGMLTGPRRPRLSAGVFERYAGVGLLALLFIIFSIRLPGLFFSYDNLVGVLGNETISAIMALGLLIPLAAGVFDISIGNMMTLSMVIAVALFQNTAGGIPIFADILLVLGAALVVGLVNGLLVVKLKIDPFIATIGTGSIILGMSQLIAHGETLSEHVPSAFTTIGRAKFSGMPVTVIYALVLSLLVWYLLRFTPLGRMVYATGAGREAARLSGVRTDRILFLAFLFSALCAAIAGVVFAARIGSAPPDVGASYLLPAFATAFLGSTIIEPGRFNVGGLLVAIFIIAIGINGLQLMGIPFWVVDTFQGTALIVAVVLSRLRGMRA
jgi:ribose transport system permease protein